MQEAEIILLLVIFVMNVISLTRQNGMEARLNRIEKIVDNLTIQKGGRL